MDVVYSYDSGKRLPGIPSDDLVEASRDEGSTGAVPAYRDADGVWQYVQPSDVEHYRCNLREHVITIYVMEV